MVVVSVIAAMVVVRSLQQDFAAYWVAGAVRRLGLDPYANYAGLPGTPAPWDGVGVFAHSRFLYPPLVADLLRPWAALPYLGAKALFTAAGLACWATATVVGARVFDSDHGDTATLGLVAGALYFPLYVHLERGQIDLPALLLVLAAFAARERPAVAGAALAAAVGLKPALVLVVPVWAALGRWRIAAAAVVFLALLAAATAATSGWGLLRAYAVTVLPRAALTGEGGGEAMLLPPDRLAAVGDAAASGFATLDGRRYQQSLWDGPLSASLPRLLAPEAPTRLTATAPAAVALAAMCLVARAIRRRARDGRPRTAGEGLVLFAAAVASVVTSPSGWSMGLVWGLPLVPLVRGARAAGRLNAVATRGLVGALAACACPPVFPGWGALAGAALVAAALLGAVTLEES